MTLIDLDTDLRTDRTDRTDRTATDLRTSDVRRAAWTIADVAINVDGTTARVRYTTDAPMVEIMITPYRPTLVDGVWVDWVLDAVDGTDFAPGRGTQDYFHRSLRPGMEYHVILTAQGDGDELPVQVLRSFTTGTTGTTGTGMPLAA